MNRSPVLLAGVALALAGCSPATRQSEYLDRASSLSTAAPPGRALALVPPAAGEVVRVLEQRHSNAIVQQIILRGDGLTTGENQVAVTAVTSLNASDSDNAKVEPPTDAAIGAELEAAFPKFRMSLSETLDRNPGGPFGYATGRAPGNVTCLYAWQYIGGDPGRLGLFSAAAMQLPMSVRVRLCRTATTPDALVAVVRQLAVVRPDGAGAYASGGGGLPLSGGDALASAGFAGLPADAGVAPAPLYQPPVEAPRMRAAPRPRRVARRARAPAAVATVREPVPTGAAVPLPSEIGAVSAPPPRLPAGRGAAVPLPD